MVDIIRGQIVKHDVVKNARGGTEMQAELMVKHIDPDLLSKFQIIHSRIREEHFEPDLLKVFVAHDLPQDPEVERLTDSSFRKQFAKIVFVSNWSLQQYNMILGVPYKESHVIRNAVEPFPYVEKNTDGPIKILYHTTPHRGLNILVPVFEKLAEIHPDIHLDVFSSFSIYGWESRDEPYQELFDRCRNHDQITYHGAVDNSIIREKLQDTHIFAYPSIWPETSCIAAIEAMSTCNYVVAPNYAALPETLAGYGVMYQWSEDIQEHANTFANALNSTIMGIKRERETGERNRVLEHQFDYCRINYGYDRAKLEWEGLFKNILTKVSK